MYDLIIVGGGAAGVSAGIYAARQKLKTLLITKEFGGQMVKKAVLIENYPGFKEISGLELFKKFKEQLIAQEIEIKEGEAERIEKKGAIFLIHLENKTTYQSKTVIIASGVDPRSLTIPGAEEFVGKGLSYCVTCDGPLFSGKTVAVIGGGNAGFEAAIYLSRIAQKIYLLEYKPEIGADEKNQETAKKIAKIEVITNAALKEIRGNLFVDSIVYQDRKSNKALVLSLAGVFVEIGYVPASAVVADLVDFNEKKEIKIDQQTCATKTPGLFAAGDVTDVKNKQIVIAAGQGATAALSVYEYLRKLGNEK